MKQAQSSTQCRCLTIFKGTTVTGWLSQYNVGVAAEGGESRDKTNAASGLSYTGEFSAELTKLTGWNIFKSDLHTLVGPRRVFAGYNGTGVGWKLSQENEESSSTDKRRVSV